MNTVYALCFQFARVRSGSVDDMIQQWKVEVEVYSVPSLAHFNVFFFLFKLCSQYCVRVLCDNYTV